MSSARFNARKGQRANTHLSLSAGRGSRGGGRGGSGLASLLLSGRRRSKLVHVPETRTSQGFSNEASLAKHNTRGKKGRSQRRSLFSSGSLRIANIHFFRSIIGPGARAGVRKRQTRTRWTRETYFSKSGSRRLMCVAPCSSMSSRPASSMCDHTYVAHSPTRRAKMGSERSSDPTAG